MKAYPKISIVTPNYNGGEFLEETIKSVLKQNYPNLEYIVIDGGSTDNSIEVIKKYQDKLSYWVSEPDNGLYHAIQKGFDKSTGEIMAWINSDDMYLSKSFSVVSEIFSSFSRVNWLLGMPSAYDEQGRIIRIDKFKRWSKFDYYTMNYQWIQQESVFWRRSLWEQAGNGLNTEYSLASDLELWTRFFRSEKLYVTTALLSGFRTRSKNQLSLEGIDNYKEEAENILRNERNTIVSKADLKVANKVIRYREKGRRSHHLIRFVYNYLTKKLIKKHFDYPKLIHFDRIKQSFILEGND